MIHVNKAIDAAVNYLQSLSKASPGKFFDVRLEEVEPSDDETFWLITLGYTVKVEVSLNESSDYYNMFLDLPEMNKPHERIYKTFHVNAENGIVKSMKMRTI
ncbi:MAG: hypothetical protein F6J87_17120 [Spirulina sp. SIO3F2]|nr:hypothetical protein [Spirulina sp. SIO3F2]